MRCGTFSCTLPDSSRATRRASGRNVLRPVPGVPAARSGAATAASRPEQPTEPIDRHGECALHPATLPRSAPSTLFDWSTPCTARRRVPYLSCSDRPVACDRNDSGRRYFACVAEGGVGVHIRDPCGDDDPGKLPRLQDALRAALPGHVREERLAPLGPRQVLGGGVRKAHRAPPRRDGDVGRGRRECNGACHGRGLCRLSAAEPARLRRTKPVERRCTHRRASRTADAHGRDGGGRDVAAKRLGLPAHVAVLRSGVCASPYRFHPYCTGVAP